MARTSLGPWTFVRDMGSSSHSGLIIAPGQDVNGELRAVVFYLLNKNCIY